MIGRKLKGLIKDFQFVPYKLKENQNHEVGRTYWNGYWQQWYKVTGIEGRMIKAQWGDGKVTQFTTRLDYRYDYELRPFEYSKDKPVTQQHLTYTEWKVLSQEELIPSNVGMELIKKYFKHECQDSILEKKYWVYKGNRDGKSVVELRNEYDGKTMVAHKLSYEENAHCKEMQSF